MINVVNFQSDKNNIENHKNANDKQFECSICRKRFSRQGNCSVHQRIHLESKPKYQCKDCPRRFHWKCNLLVHEKQHKMDKYDCISCLRSFRSEEKFKKHMQVCNKVGEKLKCNWCVKRFTNKYKLNYHMKHCHSSILPFYCKLCHNKFGTSMKLRKHSHEVHLNGKPYRCEKCFKTFLTQHNLNIHSKTHRQNYERFSCFKCDQKFLHKYSLRIHMKRVHAIKYAKKQKTRPTFALNSFKCKTCQKRFAYEKLANKCALNHKPNNIQIGVSVINEDTNGLIVPLFDMHIPISIKTFTPIILEHNYSKTDHLMDFSNRIGILTESIQEYPIDYSMKSKTTRT